jgi:hypothetical protein
MSMASVAKWLRQWIVIPPFVGSIPIIRPFVAVDSLNKAVVLIQNHGFILGDLLSGNVTVCNV